jgi:hypothetical protein
MLGRRASEPLTVHAALYQLSGVLLMLLAYEQVLFILYASYVKHTPKLLATLV